MKRWLAFVVTFSVLILCFAGLLMINSSAIDTATVYEVTFERDNATTVLFQGDNAIGEIVEWPQGSGNHALRYEVNAQSRPNQTHPFIVIDGVTDFLAGQENIPAGSLTIGIDMGCAQEVDCYLYPLMVYNETGECYFDGGAMAPGNGEFVRKAFYSKQDINGFTSGGKIAFCDEQSVPANTVIYIDNIRMEWNGDYKTVNVSHMNYPNTSYGVEYTSVLHWAPTTTTIATSVLEDSSILNDSSVATSPFTYGDVNDDTEIDMKDVLNLRKYIMDTNEPINAQAADVNVDQFVDMKDVLMLRKYIAHIIDTLGTGEITSEVSSQPTISTTSTTKATTTTTQPVVSGNYFQYTTSQQNGSLGVWWWNCNTAKTASSYTSKLQFLQNNHVTEIYLCVIPNNMTNEQIANFIRAAASYGMRVAWLGGDVSYILPGDTGYWSLYNAFDTYQKQAASDAKFYGIHLDVEPHQNTSLADQTKWQYYIDYAQSACDRAHNDGYVIEWDIPFWLETKTVSFNNQSNVNLAKAIMSISDAVTLMSYRDTAEAVLLVGAEEIALENNTHCKVILGVETNQSYEGDFITFYEEGKATLYSELTTVFQNLSGRGLSYGYGGAIHYIDSWMSLKE